MTVQKEGERLPSRETMSKGFAIAIDGPVAAGKGTIARLLAERLNGFYLYTGGMYRSVALNCIEKGIDLNDKRSVLDTLPKIEIGLSLDKVSLNGRDVTERIKGKDTASGASVVALYPGVRQDLGRRQQEIAQRELFAGKIVVAEGRDAATRILPRAAVKIFLTAQILTRAKRRKEQEHLPEDIDTIAREIEERDRRDLQRPIDALVAEPEKFGYVLIDNSDQSEEETLNAVLQELRERKLIDGAH